MAFWVSLILRQSEAIIISGSCCSIYLSRKDCYN